MTLSKNDWLSMRLQALIAQPHFLKLWNNPQADGTAVLKRFFELSQQHPEQQHFNICMILANLRYMLTLAKVYHPFLQRFVDCIQAHSKQLARSDLQKIRYLLRLFSGFTPDLETDDFTAGQAPLQDEVAKIESFKVQELRRYLAVALRRSFTFHHLLSLCHELPLDGQFEVWCSLPPEQFMYMEEDGRHIITFTLLNEFLRFPENRRIALFPAAGHLLARLDHTDRAVQKGFRAFWKPVHKFTAENRKTAIIGMAFALEYPAANMNDTLHQTLFRTASGLPDQFKAPAFQALLQAKGRQFNRDQCSAYPEIIEEVKTIPGPLRVEVFTELRKLRQMMVERIDEMFAGIDEQQNDEHG